MFSNCEQKYVDFRKVVKVVKSCVEPEQCRCGMIYLTLYRRKYDIQEGILYRCLGRMVSYLQDTRDHAIDGVHRPEHNGFNVVKHFPDLNDYLFDILGIKV